MNLFPAKKSYFDIPEREISEEEYKVYADILPQLIRRKERRTLFVIEDNTTIGLCPFDREMVEYFEKTSGKRLDKEMVKRFRDKNIRSYKLENKFEGNLDIVLIAQEDIEKMFIKGGGWYEFFSRYPGAYGKIDLSRIAFNDNKTLAFFYFANYYFTGRGYYVLSEKIGKNWTIIAKVLAWSS